MDNIIEGEIEESLTPLPRKQGVSITMNFFDALKKVSEGETVTRISWNNGDYCLMKDGWLTIYTKGALHTWSVSDGDMEGEDWIVKAKDN